MYLNITATASPSPSGPTIDGHTLPPWFSIAFSGALIGFGVISNFVGLRFIRSILFVLSFLAAGVASFLPLYDHLTGENGVYISLGVAGAVALLAGSIASCIPKIGVCVSGIAFGMTIGVVVNTLALSRISGLNDSAKLGISLGTGAFLGGLLAILMTRVIIILATSVVGSYCIVRGAGYFIGGFPDEFAISKTINENGSLPTSVYIYLGCWAGLTILGILIQSCFTAPKKKKRRSSSSDSDRDYSQLDVSDDHMASILAKKDKSYKKKSSSNTEAAAIRDKWRNKLTYTPQQVPQQQYAPPSMNNSMNNTNMWQQQQLQQQQQQQQFFQQQQLQQAMVQQSYVPSPAYSSINVPMATPVAASEIKVEKKKKGFLARFSRNTQKKNKKDAVELSAPLLTNNSNNNSMMMERPAWETGGWGVPDPKEKR